MCFLFIVMSDGANNIIGTNTIIFKYGNASLNGSLLNIRPIIGL